MVKHFIHPVKRGQYIHMVNPNDYGWNYLEFNVLELAAGEKFSYATISKEAAIVPLSGKFSVTVNEETFNLQRQCVFSAMPQVLYVPPTNESVITALEHSELAIGAAPAEGKYPVRLFQPKEMKQEVRGKLPAQRQVNHILAHPLPAERLILFEVYVPGGSWSGWPPHCHDEFNDSPYLEETYFYRFEPKPSGFGIHRNYTANKSFDETFSVGHNDLVLVTQGFHPTVAAPGSKMYFLNYLAGKLYDDERSTPPTDDKDWAFMKDGKWGHNRFSFPAFDAEGVGRLKGR